VTDVLNDEQGSVRVRLGDAMRGPHPSGIIVSAHDQQHGAFDAGHRVEIGLRALRRPFAQLECQLEPVPFTMAFDV
jgi:hypothetical protein